MFIPISCVVGHVDAGKTSLLDKLRDARTKEVGGITQQLGSTNISKERLEEILTESNMTTTKFNIPGLNILDTPGHADFTTLRLVGAKISNLVILVVDIIKGLEKSTIEAINILKELKVDFVIALNKVDRIYGWKSCPNQNLKVCFKSQDKSVIELLDKYVSDIVLQLAKEEINALTYYTNKDTKTFVSMIPVSAKTGEGIPDLLLVMSTLLDLKIKKLNKTELFTQSFGYILEKKFDSKHGDFYLSVNCTADLETSDQLDVITNNGSIEKLKIKYFLVPNDEKEIRDRTILNRVDKVSGGKSYGIKFEENKNIQLGSIYFKNNSSNLISKEQFDQLEKSKYKANLISGDDYIEYDELKFDQFNKSYDKLLSKIGVGVIVPSTSLLDALIKTFENVVPISSFETNSLTKTFIIKAKTTLNTKNPYEKAVRELYKVILIFDPNVNPSYLTDEIKLCAQKEGMTIIQAQTIYKLKDLYIEYKEKIIKHLNELHFNATTFKLEMIPEFIFLKRTPLLFGVKVKEGKLNLKQRVIAKKGDKKVVLGFIEEIRKDKTSIEFAVVKDEVCIKINNLDEKFNFPKDFDLTFELENEDSVELKEIRKFLGKYLQ